MGWSLGLIALFAVACNLLVILSARGKCYGSVEEIPKSDYGILLGTGRSAKSSPYYDAKIEAAVELLKAGKIEALVISGENLYEDYHEVDSMVAEIRRAVPEVSMALVDTDGTNTIESYNSYHSIKETHSETLPSPLFTT